MRNLLPILLLATILSACATTDQLSSNSELKEPELLAKKIRPVENIKDSSIESDLAMVRAQDDYKNERYEKSFDLFQIISLKEKTNVPAHLGWGNSAIALNLFERAKSIFSEMSLETATQDEKNSQLAGLVLAEVGTHTADDEEVRLNEALEYNLGDLRLWNALGRFHDNQKRPDLAERTYEKAANVGEHCLLYTSPSPRDQRGSRMPSSA